MQVINHSLSNPSTSFFLALFMYLCYAINIANVFHNVKLALYAATILHSIQKWQKITRNLETRWIARKRRKSTMIGYAEVDEYWLKSISWNWIMMKLMSKKAWGKRKKQVLRRESWLIHHLQNMSHQKIYTFWYYVVNDEVPSTSSQIVERIVTYSRCSFTRNIYLEWLSTRASIKLIMEVHFAPS